MNEENTQNIESTETEAPVTPPAPEPGTNEYNARMAAEGSVALGNVPDKFKNEDGTVNMEAFAQSYMELEKQFHAPKEEPVVKEASNTESLEGPDAVVDELRVPDVDETTENLVEEAANVGITKEDLSSMTAEIMKTGLLSEEQRASLNSRGVEDVVIDAVVEGQKAKMKEQYAVAADIVGSSERLSKIFGWAAHNLDETQRAHINAGLASNASEVTLRGLASMYDAAVANQPQSTEMRSATKPAQNPSGRETIAGYSTKAEYYAAYEDLMKNPHDKNLRNAVEDRMRQTDWTTIA
tara:strand:- start:1438 stop:2325 length:888 start_codon:yes stop_codon:yes gene_type:complete